MKNIFKHFKNVLKNVPKSIKHILKIHVDWKNIF